MSSAAGPPGSISRSCRRRRGRRPASPSSSATGPTTPSASAWSSPTRRSRPSRTTISRATARSPRISPIGTISRSTSREPCTASAATASAAARARHCSLLQDQRARARRRDQIPARRDRHRRANARRRSRHRLRTASIRACAKPSRTISSRISTCGRTSSPGWARPGRSTPSPSSSAKRNTASSSSHCYQYEPGRSTWMLETDPDTFEKCGLDTLDEAGTAQTAGRALRRGIAGPQAHHQPLDLAQFPDDPLRPLGRTRMSCCSATPRRPRISRSARAPSSRWKMRSRSMSPSARRADRM